MINTPQILKYFWKNSLSVKNFLKSFHFMKLIIIGFLFPAMIFFASCATTESQIANETKQEEPVVETDSVVNWKNRGFGSEEPKWLYPLLQNDFTELHSAITLSPENIFVAILASGDDTDFLENKVDLFDFPEKSNATLQLKSWITIQPVNGETFYQVAAVYSVGKNLESTTDKLINLDTQKE